MFRGGAINLRIVLVTVLAFAVIICGGETIGASEHPLSIVKADIYVTKTKVVMRLTCFAEDLELLHGVEPYEDGKYDNTELEEGTQNHAEYLLEKIVIMDADGEPYKGKIS